MDCPLKEPHMTDTTYAVHTPESAPGPQPRVFGHSRLPSA